MANGEVRLMLAESSKFVAAVRSIESKDSLTLEECLNFFKNMDVAKLDGLKAAGCVIYTVVQQPNQALWIPCGWLVGELVCRGVLIYGVRKTVVTCSGESEENYQTMMGLYRTTPDGEKVVAKMQEFLPIIKKDSD